MVITPQSLSEKRPHLIAMVHVLSTNALENTVYNDRFGIRTYRTQDVAVLREIRKVMSKLHAEAVKEHQLDCLKESRSSVFILKAKEMGKVENQLRGLPFIQEMIDRALTEVEIYARNGIQVIEIENAGAPYFIGSDVPLEELAILHIVAQSVRQAFPDLMMGVHVLAGDELESLPIAMASDAYFVRSETSVFAGFRPEGRMHNRGNLAKFYYLRNYLNAYRGIEQPAERRYPQIWSDLQKKHTVFETELQDLNIWLDNVLFVKLEGIILTGEATGKNIAEKNLIKAREVIDRLEQSTADYFGQSVNIPIITGSGLDVEAYKKYADYIITGTQLKHNKYWENQVSEEHVKALVDKFA